MEHPCYKCGGGVEDGTPFCPRCSAPQIRVASSEPASLAVAFPETTNAAPAGNGAPTGVDWAQVLPPAGISVLAAIFLILLGMPAGFGMVIAGFLSVILYHRRRPFVHLTAAKGARVGVITGALGFGVFAVMLTLVTILGSGKEIHDAIVKYFQQAASQNADPRLQQLLDLVKTPDGYTALLILCLVVTLLAFLIFSSLGGAIAAFLLYRRERH